MTQIVLNGHQLACLCDFAGIETTATDDELHNAAEVVIHFDGGGARIAIDEDDGTKSFHQMIAWDSEAGRDEGVASLDLPVI